ncbi:hypothetical protein TW95_gp0136 [Pandoravirus inopinatum]|uniref:Uncharacterized protein n=1 Tax=Pandoravirus inopinatum TaxID=1605721 RepID=A0A0B5J5E3_9VIRU|nr:hypothetical protein TW95_gp0136 [Pandoravirus inopinatum]AJF96870.1 hypothetical protein [Pandoravirus inopinatum]
MPHGYLPCNVTADCIFFERKNLGGNKRETCAMPPDPAPRLSSVCVSSWGCVAAQSRDINNEKNQKPSQSKNICLSCGARVVSQQQNASFLLFPRKEDIQSPTVGNVSAADARRPMPARLFFVGRSFGPQPHRPPCGLGPRTILFFRIVDGHDRRIGPLKLLSRTCGSARSRRPQVHTYPSKKKFGAWSID